MSNNDATAPRVCNIGDTTVQLEQHQKMEKKLTRRLLKESRIRK